MSRVERDAGEFPARGDPARSRASLRIALNATAAVAGGGTTYWLNLLPALAGRPLGHRLTRYAPERENRLPDDHPPHFRVERIRFGRPATLRRLLWEQLRLPMLLKRDRADVLLAPADIASFWSPCPVVLAIRNT